MNGAVPQPDSPPRRDDSRRRTTTVCARQTTPRLGHDDARPSARRWLALGAYVFIAITGCQANLRTASLLPSRPVLQTPTLRVMTDVKLDKNHRLLRDLANLREELAAMLDLPEQKQPVNIYLFPDEARYTEFMRKTYPRLQPRRAYFVGTPHELAVYTYWGDKIQEDLRHEYTHGVLHASLKDVPLWLDEGLAEYFEVTEAADGLNRVYATRLVSNLKRGWQPNLSKLEQMENVSDMSSEDYQEAWAWVHFLMHDSDDSRQVLVDYLRELRTTPVPGPLSTRLRAIIPHADVRFASHTAGLSSHLR